MKALISTLIFGLTIGTQVQANCLYTLGTATDPQGRSIRINELNPQAYEILEEKGYVESTVYKSDLMLVIRADQQKSYGVLGSVATVLLRDVITKETFAEGKGTFTAGFTIEFVSALENLPTCKESQKK